MSITNKSFSRPCNNFGRKLSLGGGFSQSAYSNDSYEIDLNYSWGEGGGYFLGQVSLGIDQGTSGTGPQTLIILLCILNDFIQLNNSKTFDV